MGVQYCLESLKTSLHQLKVLDKAAHAYAHRSDGTNMSMLIDGAVAVDEMVSHASTVVFPMLQKLDAIYRGQPLEFKFVDNYTPALQENPTKIYTMFKKRMLGPSGLRHHLHHANDRELFDTYRAIGCTTFTAFELLVHRAVAGLEVEIDDLKTVFFADPWIGRLTEREGEERKWASEKHVHVQNQEEDGEGDEDEAVVGVNVDMSDSDGELVDMVYDDEVEAEVENDMEKGYVFLT